MPDQQLTSGIPPTLCAAEVRIIEPDADFSPRSSDIGGHRCYIGRVVDQLSVERAIIALESASPAIRRVAAKYLRRGLSQNDGWNEIEAALKEKPPFVQAQLLIMLSSCTFLTANHPALQETTAALKSDSRDVRLAAARAIALRFPGHADKLFSLEGSEGYGEVERWICFSQNSGLIESFAARLGYPERKELPPAFGLLITTAWLGYTHESNPELVNALAQDYGFTGGPLTSRHAELLREGVMHVSADMLLEDALYLRTRILDFNKTLLGIMTGMRMGEIEPLKLGDALDEALFIAALRESDHANAAAYRDHDPYDYKYGPDGQQIRVAVCCHVPYQLCRRVFIDSSVKLAEELGVPQKERANFVLERAAYELDSSYESLLEGRLIFNAGWRVSLKTGLPGRVPESMPIVKDSDAPLLKFAVLDHKRPFRPSFHRDLSKGAAAVANIGLYLGKDDIVSELRAIEANGRGKLPVIGCELQCSRTGSEAWDSLAWKQAFRYFGVKSPRRLEYGAMVELAFPPAAAWEVFTRGINLLPELGFVSKPAEGALHISIEGDLGSDVNYIAFPQQFIRRSTHPLANDEDRWRFISRVMSKGYVCLNSDTDTAYGGKPPACRTELRLYGVKFQPAESGFAPDPEFEGDFRAAQLLSAAIISDKPELTDVWLAYRDAIDRYVAGLHPAFKDLLQSDWYEASGNPYDHVLVPQLQIIKRKSEVRRILAEEGIGEKLRADILQLRDRHTAEIAKIIF